MYFAIRNGFVHPPPKSERMWRQKAQRFVKRGEKDAEYKAAEIQNKMRHDFDFSM